MTVAAAMVTVGGIGAVLSYDAAGNATDAASAAADKQSAIARRQQDLAEKQYADTQARQAKFDPLYEQMMTSTLQDAQTARERGADQWNQYLTTFRPLEEKMASTAANYDTTERRNQEAADAVSGVTTQFDKAQQAQTRNLSRAGIALDSGRALTLGETADFAKAKAAAGADRTARKQVEATGINLVHGAAAFGRNQTGTALTASGQGAGDTATASGIGSTVANIANSGAASTGSLLSGAAGTLGSVANLYGNQASAANQAVGQLGQGLGYYLKNGSGLNLGFGSGNSYTGAGSTGYGVGNAGAGNYTGLGSLP